MKTTVMLLEPFDQSDGSRITAASRSLFQYVAQLRQSPKSASVPTCSCDAVFHLDKKKKKDAFQKMRSNQFIVSMEIAIDVTKEPMLKYV